MGGHGSGRQPWSRRCIVEHCIRLDIRAFARKGALQPGCRVEGECYPSIPHTGATLPVRFLFDAERPEPSYSFSYSIPGTGERVTVEGALLWNLEAAAPTAYFACPECMNRRAVLFLPPGASRFTCRVCARLRYAAEPMTVRARLERQAARLYRKAGSDNRGLTFTPRPKGMRRQTFEGYMDKAGEYDRRAAALAVAPRLSAPGDPSVVLR